MSLIPFGDDGLWRWATPTRSTAPTGVCKCGQPTEVYMVRASNMCSKCDDEWSKHQPQDQRWVLPGDAVAAGGTTKLPMTYMCPGCGGHFPITVHTAAEVDAGGAILEFICRECYGEDA